MIFWSGLVIIKVNFMAPKYLLTLLALASVNLSFAEDIIRPGTSVQSDQLAKDQSESPIPENRPKFKLVGFGTLGVLNSSQSSGDYVLDSFMPTGAGRSDNLDTNNYSKIAGQLNALFTPRVSAQIQVISTYHADRSFQPEVEWLNLKYAFNSDASVRIGRIELPTFLDSGNHDVGYSYVWAHLPTEIYHVLSIPNSDGIDATYRIQLGDGRHSFKALFGQNVSDRPTSTTTSNDMWGIFDKVEYDQTTFNLSYQKRSSSNQNNLTGTSNGWYESYDISLGLNYDPGDWFFISEWIQSQTRYKNEAMYLSAGYRFKKFTPYFMHSQNGAGSYLSPSSQNGTPVSRAIRSQHTDSVGVRWDFMKNYDFKFQYDRIMLSDNSNGFLINVPTNIKLHGDTFYAVSAVVDFLF
jgi:hypothetical protein